MNMNKKTIITILFSLVSMTGWAQKADALVVQRTFKDFKFPVRQLAN